MNGAGAMKRKARNAKGFVPRTPGPRVFVSALLLLGGIAGLAGCGGKDKPGIAEAQRPAVSNVEVTTVSPSPQETVVEAMGTIRSRNIAVVASQVMGRLTSFPVSEGSRVERGALLATIDDAAIRAQAAAADGMAAEAVAARDEAEGAVAQAEAGKALAEKTYARYRKLHEEKVVTQQEFEEVEAKRTVAAKDYERALERRAQAAGRIAQAKGQADAAKAMLSYTKVTAPFAGVVTEKKADAGSMAVPGMPLLVLEDTRRYRLEAAVPEAHLSRLSVGSKVEVVLDAAPGKPLPATVSEIVPAVDPASRTFVAKADVSGSGLRTGMYGRLRFSTGKETVLAVPQRAVSRAGGFDGVFVVNPDNVVRLVIVKTGRQMGDRIEILSGIDPGVRVAVSPVDRLSDGARVEIRK